MQSLQPYGHGNAEPLMIFESVTVVDLRRVGADRTHLKVTLKDSVGQIMDGIAFRYELDPPKDQPLKVIAQLDINEWQNRVTPQLVIKQFDNE